jgi:hypothetical protein
MAQRPTIRTPLCNVISSLRPNEWLISCKRLVQTYGPLSPLGGPDMGGAPADPRLSATLAG